MADRSQRSRILLVAHGLPPESVGGVEQHVEGLARALAADGHDVHVYAKSGREQGEQGELVDEVGEAPYRVTRVVYRYQDVGSLSALYARPLLDEAMARFLAHQPRFDVAHIHHFTGISTGIVARLHAVSVPIVFTLHDYWSICPRGQMWHRDGTACARVEPARCADCLRPGFGSWIPSGDAGARLVGAQQDEARRLLAEVDALVVPSARALPPFLELGVPAARLHVIENGVAVDALAALPLPDVTAARRLRIGYLGTLVPSKGLDVLVRAWQRLPPGESELHVHGNVAPYHDDVGFLTRTLSVLRPQDRFHFHGPYRTEDLPAILAGVDFLVAPALWEEAFGLTVREALAAGRPVVVSRIGGLQDAVVDGVGGRLVAPGDATELSEVLAEWCGDRPALARMAAAARERCRVRDFAAMAADLLALYASIARRA